MSHKRIARRALLKGAIAAPAVFSVRTASAQTEYVQRCIANGMAQAAVRKPVALANVDNDDWYRVPVDIYQLSVYQGATLKPVEGKFILGVDKVRYWKINDTSGLRATVGTPTTHTVGRCVATKTGEVRHALVYVDRDGNQVGLAFEPRNGVAAFTSCLVSSMNPGLRSRLI